VLASQHMVEAGGRYTNNAKNSSLRSFQKSHYKRVITKSSVGPSEHTWCGIGGR